jgi:hypothetical protein
VYNLRWFGSSISTGPLLLLPATWLVPLSPGHDQINLPAAALAADQSLAPIGHGRFGNAPSSPVRLDRRSLDCPTSVDDIACWDREPANSERTTTVGDIRREVRSLGSEVRLCWICGAVADSREHKFKRSDLLRAADSWSPSDQPSLLRGNRLTRIRGPNSNLVKFSSNICHDCNTTRTQPYDRAYEVFSNWVVPAGARLLDYNELDFSEIYGSEFSHGVLSLLRYVAKHFGCRIVHEGSPLPSDLAAALGRDDLSPFTVSFNVSATCGDFPIRGTVGNYPVVSVISRVTGEVNSPKYLSGFFSGYLDIIYHYDLPLCYPWEGDVISAPQRRVRLGHYDPVNSQPHPANNEAPGRERRSVFRIGNKDFVIPELSPQHWRHIMSLEMPRKEMTIRENLDARIAVIQAIVSPLYPAVTYDFLRQHLTVSLSDQILASVFWEFDDQIEGG